MDHPAYHHVAGDIYAGSRTEILFRCALLCKVCQMQLLQTCSSRNNMPAVHEARACRLTTMCASGGACGIIDITTEANTNRALRNRIAMRSVPDC